MFMYIQNFVKNTKQILFGFTSWILREIACSRQIFFYEIFNLFFSALKSLISNICISFSVPDA